MGKNCISGFMSLALFSRPRIWLQSQVVLGSNSVPVSATSGQCFLLCASASVSLKWGPSKPLRKSCWLRSVNWPEAFNWGLTRSKLLCSPWWVGFFHSFPPALCLACRGFSLHPFQMNVMDTFTWMYFSACAGVYVSVEDSCIEIQMYTHSTLSQTKGRAQGCSGWGSTSILLWLNIYLVLVMWTWHFAVDKTGPCRKGLKSYEVQLREETAKGSSQGRAGAQEFIHSVSHLCLSSTYYVPGPRLCPCDALVTNTDMLSALMALLVSMVFRSEIPQETDINQIITHIWNCKPCKRLWRKWSRNDDTV